MVSDAMIVVMIGYAIGYLIYTRQYYYDKLIGSMIFFMASLGLFLVTETTMWEIVLIPVMVTMYLMATQIINLGMRNRA